MEIENADRQLGGALYVAALLKKKEKLIGKKSATPQEIRNARHLLKIYPDLVPQYDNGVLKWPKTVKRYMTRNYDPNTRAVVL